MKVTVFLIYIFCIFCITEYSASTASAENNIAKYYRECNTPIKYFLDNSTGVISVPEKKEGKAVVSVQAVVDFRESHGAYQSNFGFENTKTGDRIELFREVKRSDKNERGDDDWIGTIEGGILGGKPSSKKASFIPGSEYKMIIWGEDNPRHKQDATSARTSLKDAVADNNPNTYTFYSKMGMFESKIKSIKLLNPAGYSISTIVGFEDGWRYAPADYNDIIIELCLIIKTN